MALPKSRRTVTYIVRIWAEYLDESPPRWCGVVEPVGGGEKIHFTHLNQIVDCIQQKTHHSIKKENES